jgi:hypothetical protein
MSASHISKTSASDTDCSKRRLTLLPGGLVDREDPGLADRLPAKPLAVVQGFDNAPAIQGRKERDVLDQLPEAERPWVRAKLRKAWRNPDADQAIRDLRALAGRLNTTTPDAAISLVDGLEEMFMALRTEEPPTISASHASKTSTSDTDCSKPGLSVLPGRMVDPEDPRLAGRLADRLAGKPLGLVQGFTDNATTIRGHKERDVLDRPPEAEPPWVRSNFRQPWCNPDVDHAIRDLCALAGRPNKTSPKAAIRMLGGLEKMFSVIRLGVPGALLKTVMSTNPVESTIEIVRNHARTVNLRQPGAVHGMTVTT